MVFIHRQESGRAKKLRLPSPSASARAYSSDHERHCFGPHKEPSAAGRPSPAPKCCLGSTSVRRFAAPFAAPSGVAISRIAMGSAKPSKRKRNPGCLVESGGGDEFPSPIVATHAVHRASRAAESTLHLALLGSRCCDRQRGKRGRNEWRFCHFVRCVLRQSISTRLGTGSANMVGVSRSRKECHASVRGVR